MLSSTYWNYPKLAKNKPGQLFLFKWCRVGWPCTQGPGKQHGLSSSLIEDTCLFNRGQWKHLRFQQQKAQRPTEKGAVRCRAVRHPQMLYGDLLTGLSGSPVVHCTVCSCLLSCPLSSARTAVAPWEGMLHFGLSLTLPTIKSPWSYLQHTSWQEKSIL